MLSARQDRPTPDVHVFSDAAHGLRAVIAIDDTRLGPAFGGCRFASYPDDAAAIADAERLAHGMTLKNALAGIPFGGGKAVIVRPHTPVDRRGLFEAFGRAVDSLSGTYVTAMDSGTETADMDAIRRSTRFVSGATGAEGDPAPFTARGVFEGIRAAAALHLDRPDLTGVRVAIQGVGHVGAALASLLAEAGARLVIADVVPERAEAVARATGATVLEPAALLTATCDLFAPCGLGGVLDAVRIPQLRCRIVAGAANNQLATPDMAELLARRGIVYVPDFVINAGGVMHAALAWQGASSAEIERRVRRIGVTVGTILETAVREARLPDRVALAQAEALLAAA
jgi:leucine dehydrogenase